MSQPVGKKKNINWTAETIVYYMVTRDITIETWLDNCDWVRTEQLGLADVAIFPGGEDVTPGLYGEQAIKETNYTYLRCRREFKTYHEIPAWMPKIGICRGSQFLNVMAGGKLWQHVNDHACGTHVAYDKINERAIEVTSTHHQMMIPAHDAQILCVAARATKFKNDKYTITKKPTEKGEDIEVLWYDNERILCFQPHPEYGNKECEKLFWSYFRVYVKPHIVMDEVGVWCN